MAIALTESNQGGRRSLALRARPLSICAAMALAAGMAHAQPTSVVFNGSVSTSYTVGANWNGGVVPNNTGGIFYAPVIGGGLVCDQTAANIQVDALQLTNTARLRLAPATVFRVRSTTSAVGAGLVTISNGALLELNQAGAGACDLLLDGSGPVIFSAGGGTPGRVLLNGNPNNRVWSSNGLATIQNEIIFEGGGSIGLGQTTIDNRGVFRALPTNTLLIQPGGGNTQNRGTLEADGGTLILRNTTNNLSVGPLTGTLRAVNGGVVQVEGTVNGGILQTIGAGSFISPNGSGAALVNTALDNAIVRLPSGSSLNIQGTTLGTAASEFRLEQSGPGATDLFLQGNNPVVLAGPSIILSSSSGNRVYSSSGLATLSLTNGSSIRGGGQIGLNQTAINVANLSTISADAATMIVHSSGTGLTNAGTLEARNGGTLVLRGNSSNAGGFITAQTGSIVDFDTGNHTGGTLRALGTGFLLVDGSGPNLQNFLLSEGELRIANSSALRLTGTNQINGTITLNSATGVSDAIITGNGTTTFSGTGQFRANASATNRFYSETGLGTLVLNIPFRGAGLLGLAQTTLTLNNLVDNDTAAILVISPGGSGTTNNATIRQSGTGLTQLRGRVFNESGRVEVTGPGNVDLDGCTISGGILADTGAGVFIADSAQPNLQSILLESGELRIPSGFSARFSGQNVINGSVTLNQVGTASVTNLIIAGNVPTSFGGAGELRASDSPNNRIFSDTGLGTFVLNLPFRGAGQFGIGQTTLSLNSLVENDTADTLIVHPGSGGTDNNSVIRQSGSGLTQLRGRVFNEQGRLEVTGSGNLDLDGCNLTGGVFADTGSGAIIVDSQQPLLQDFTLESGNINIAPGASFRAGGTNTINGIVNFGGATTCDIIIIGNGTTTFGGTGQIQMNNVAHRVYSETGNGRLLLAPGVTLRGAGQLGLGQTAFTNQGLILADLAPGFTLNPSGAGFTNEGQVSVSGTGTITSSGGGFTQAAGLIQVDAGRLFNRASGTVVQTGGTILSNGEFQVVSDNFQLQGGTLAGDGLVDSIVNQTGGVIDPRPSLTIEGGLTQTTASTLRIDLNGTGSNDADILSVIGPAAINGTLRVVIGTNYVITPGDQFVILTSTGSRTGTFSSVIVEPPQLGIDASVQYLGNSVLLTIDGCVICGFCNYDYNRDENVDLLDAQQMAQVFVGILTPEPNWLDGDLNLDENADLIDAQLLARAIVQGLCEL